MSKVWKSFMASLLAKQHKKKQVILAMFRFTVCIQECSEWSFIAARSPEAKGLWSQRNRGGYVILERLLYLYQLESSRSLNRLCASTRRCSPRSWSWKHTLHPAKKASTIHPIPNTTRPLVLATARWSVQLLRVGDIQAKCGAIRDKQPFTHTHMHRPTVCSPTGTSQKQVKLSFLRADIDESPDSMMQTYFPLFLHISHWENDKLWTQRSTGGIFFFFLLSSIQTRANCRFGSVSSAGVATTLHKERQ